MSLEAASTNPFGDPFADDVGVATPSSSHSGSAGQQSQSQQQHHQHDSGSSVVQQSTNLGASYNESEGDVAVAQLSSTLLPALTVTAASPQPAASPSSPSPSVPHPLMSSSPHSSHPAAVAAAADSEILTPRSLARKLEAHQQAGSRAAGALLDEDDAMHPNEISGGASFSHALAADHPDAPRFAVAVGGYRLKGDGLQTHTKYHLTTRWKQSLVEASTAAAAKLKERKSAVEEDDEGAGAPAAEPNAPIIPVGSAPPPLRIPAVSMVHRRYSDFVFLQQMLTQLFPAYLIPCLPSKGLLARFDEDFIQTRRRGLQRFLSDLAAMPPPVCDDPVIAQFLLCSAREWEALSSSLAHAHGLGGVKGTAGAAWSFTRGLFNSMVRPNPAVDSHAHDEHYEAALASSAHHEALRENYDLMHTHFEAIVLAEKELAEAWMEWYAGFEISDDSVQSSRIAATHDLLGLDFAQLLPLTQRIGLMSMRKADTEAVSMSELLQHTAGMVTQIQELFKRRHAVSAAVQQADHDLRTANAQLDTIKRRVAMGEKTSEDESRASSHALQCAAILRDRESELTKFHSVAESQVRSYTARRRAEMRDLLVAFVRMQIAHEENMQNHFNTLLTQLENNNRH